MASYVAEDVARIRAFACAPRVVELSKSHSLGGFGGDAGMHNRMGGGGEGGSWEGEADRRLLRPLRDLLAATNVDGADLRAAALARRARASRVASCVAAARALLVPAPGRWGRGVLPRGAVAALVGGIREAMHRHDGVRV